jgi:predicted DNA binding CopG/RHH family protein
MVKITINITEKELGRVRKESEDTGLSVSDIIRRIIDAHYAGK